jgi:predicted GH43/DUF377 family glycosyl hydrolase
MAASDVEHLHQLAVHSYYVGEREVGMRACERLLGERLTPEREAIVRRNRTWYTPTLDTLTDCTMRQIDIEPACEGWTVFNPTIVASRFGHLLVVRSSNYRMVDGRYVTPEADGGKIRTVNVRASLDSSLGVYRKEKPLVCLYDRSDFSVDGLEDVRLNKIGDRIVASGTVRNAAGRDGLARIGVGDVVFGEVHPVVLDEPVPGRHEKNWMPLIGTETWLYSCHEDGRVVTVSRQGDRWVLTPRGTSPLIARGFRGGSQLVPHGDGWVCVVHEVAEDEGRRTYEHRFVWFGAELSITGWSSPFVFRGQRQIEFAAGLAWLDAGRLVVTFGVRDEEAWLAVVNHDQLYATRSTP